MTSNNLSKKTQKVNNPIKRKLLPLFSYSIHKGKNCKVKRFQINYFRLNISKIELSNKEENKKGGFVIIGVKKKAALMFLLF